MGSGEEAPGSFLGNQKHRPSPGAHRARIPSFHKGCRPSVCRFESEKHWSAPLLVRVVGVRGGRTLTHEGNPSPDAL